MAKQASTHAQNQLHVRNTPLLIQFVFGVLGLSTTNLALAKGKLIQYSTAFITTTIHFLNQ